jgi:hypothetical protein
MRVLNLIWKGITIVPARMMRQGFRTTWLWLVEKVHRIRNGVSPDQTSKVTDNLWVGGQHYTRGLKQMELCGISASLNLREEADDAHGGVALKKHLWLPTPDDDAPSLEQLQDGVTFIREAVGAGCKVYIHCAQGVGRAPTMAAAYLISEGNSPREAMDMIRKVRPFITPTPIQLRRLEEWAKVARNGMG